MPLRFQWIEERLVQWSFSVNPKNVDEWTWQKQALSQMTKSDLSLILLCQMKQVMIYLNM